MSTVIQKVRRKRKVHFGYAESEPMMSEKAGWRVRCWRETKYPLFHQLTYNMKNDCASMLLATGVKREKTTECLRHVRQLNGRLKAH